MNLCETCVSFCTYTQNRSIDYTVIAQLNSWCYVLMIISTQRINSILAFHDIYWRRRAHVCVWTRLRVELDELTAETTYQ